MIKKNAFAVILSTTAAFALAATVSFGVTSAANASTVEVSSGTEIITVSGSGGDLPVQ